MFLEKPSFPVSLSEGEAEEKVSSMLNEKQWSNPAFSKHTLIFTPYWFFSYDIYKEDKHETKLLNSGLNALNAFENKLEPHIAELSKRPDFEKSNEINEELTINVLESKTTEDEAKEMILLRIASKEKVHRSQIILSGLELFFVPFWIIRIFLDEKEVGIVVNASTGEITNRSAVPVREKAFNELSSEALKELVNPLEWINYSVDLASSASKGLFASGKKTSSKNFFGISNYELQLLILAIIAILVILW